jgi:hypothetical protein
MKHDSQYEYAHSQLTVRENNIFLYLKDSVDNGHADVTSRLLSPIHYVL